MTKEEKRKKQFKKIVKVAEETLSPSDYDLLINLSQEAQEFVTQEVKSFASSQPKEYRVKNKKKSETEKDKSLIYHLEEALKELKVRGLEVEAQHVQNALVTLLLTDDLGYDETAHMDMQKLKTKYKGIFEKELHYSKTKSKELATMLLRLFQ